MRRVDVTHFVTGTSAIETAGTKSGNGAKMFEFFESISLLHKLRELVSGEKLLHSGLKWFGRNKLYRQSDIGIYSRHSILNISLDLGHTDTNLLLKKFSHQAHSPRS